MWRAQSCWLCSWDRRFTRHIPRCSVENYLCTGMYYMLANQVFISCMIYNKHPKFVNLYRLCHLQLNLYLTSIYPRLRLCLYWFWQLILVVNWCRNNVLYEMILIYLSENVGQYRQIWIKSIKKNLANIYCLSTAYLQFFYATVYIIRLYNTVFLFCIYIPIRPLLRVV